ncbi:MAG TPA: hypothetical protein VKX33_05660 [Cyclobacteriaceae bacterium]|nr:hypothetical protein [Cyclobacteriaceae bacterium]
MVIENSVVLLFNEGKNSTHMATKHPVFDREIILGIFFIICSTTFSQAQETIEQDNGQVISLHFIDLKPGVDTIKFEHWVREEFNPAYFNLVPGFSFYIAKIDRGTPAQLGKYAKIIIHKSKASRDALWPKDGEPDKDATAIIYQVWNRLYTEYANYIEDTGHADYIELRKDEGIGVSDGN